MINNIYELSDKITDFANIAVQTACEKTSSGNYILDAKDICEQCNMEYTDYLKYLDLIQNEIAFREEVLDLIINDEEVDLNCGLSYCPNYEWIDGDEIIFECSEEEFDNRIVEPVRIHKSLNELADIGEEVIKNYPDVFNEIQINKSISSLEAGQAFFESSNQRIVFLRELQDDNYWLCDIYDDDFNFLYQKDITGKAIAQEILTDVFQKDPEAQSILLTIDLNILYKQIKKCPFDEKIRSRIDSIEKKLGIYDRYVDISNDLYVGKWRVHIVPEGGKYGLDNRRINDTGSNLIEFYDLSADKEIFPDGQFAGGRYFISSFLNSSNQHENSGLSLSEDWYVLPSEMKKIYNWLEQQPLKEKDKPSSLNNLVSSAENRSINSNKEQNNINNNEYYPVSDGFFDYYVNKATGEKKITLGKEDVLVENKFDDFTR